MGKDSDRLQVSIGDTDLSGPTWRVDTIEGWEPKPGSAGDDDLRNARTVHIDIPIQAPADEVEAFEDALANFVGEWMESHPERAAWDPFMHSHAEACEDSDHCYGPGSRARDRTVDTGTV